MRDIYNLNSSNEFEMALITSELGFVGRYQPLAVVQSMSEGINSEGEKATMLTVFQSGETKTVAVDEECTGYNIHKLDAGDIIQYMSDINGDMLQVELVYRAEDYGLGCLGEYAIAENSISDSSVKYVFGILCNVMPIGFDITYDFEAWNDGGISEPYFFDFRENTTAALVDSSKLAVTPSTAISKLSYISSFRATKPNYYQKYVVVARVEDGDIVDAVSYLLPSNITAEALNCHGEYVISN